MAAVAVHAELKFRDGVKEKISVNVENNLSSLINGIHDLNPNVSRLLSELVDREKALGDCVEGEEEEDSDELEADHPENSEVQPPAKRSKT
ncbi:uncharacterized protein [Pagrus major]|uniref:uncharacterized protein n=1 Tax=Pagrus major TaxID=143350 RepID=UPI003CC89FFE